MVGSIAAKKSDSSKHTSWCTVPRNSATRFAQIKSMEPRRPTLYVFNRVANPDPLCLQIMAVISELSKPPDNNAPMGRSLINRFCTASISSVRVLCAITLLLLLLLTPASMAGNDKFVFTLMMLTASTVKYL